jgi:mannose-1-phosphate guanylyltransferase
MPTANARIWVAILAGGEGERLRPLVQRWLGRHVPKQCCTFQGTRSMLDHTLDRAVQLARPDRVVTVMARLHASLPPTSTSGSQPRPGRATAGDRAGVCFWR